MAKLLKVSENSRFLVGKRAKWCCEYCRSQEQFSPQRFTIDHYDPQSKGGNNDFENLVFSCQGCNGCKSNRTGANDPNTQDFVPFYNPRTQIWDEHFAWSNDFTEIIGLTPIGRVTVIKLKLNRPILVNFRAFLYKTGEHPFTE
jgi:HNH endonuclease